MKRIEEAVEIRYVYEAIDGKKFTSENDCQLYEEYLAIKDKVWSDFIFFHQDYKTKDFIIVEEPEAFDYAVVVENTYAKYRKFLPRDFADLKRKGGLYYRDYSNAFSGGNGWNGWRYVCDCREIENLIKFNEKFKSYERERVK